MQIKDKLYGDCNGGETSWNFRKGESKTCLREVRNLSRVTFQCARRLQEDQKKKALSKQNKSSVILLHFVHSTLTSSDKSKHLKNLFWIVRAQILNICVMVEAVVLEHCLLANIYLGGQEKQINIV